MVDGSNNRNLGLNIKEIIEKQGYTQKEVAIGADIAESNLSRIVKGATPSVTTLEKIANFLNVPKESFYNGDVRNTELASIFFDNLPNDLAEAFTDKRNTEYLLFGLECKDSELSLDDIRMAMEIIKKHQDVKKKK